MDMFRCTLTIDVMFNNNLLPSYISKLVLNISQGIAEQSVI